MKRLSQLVELFERDPSFWKEWKKDAVSAVHKRGFLSNGAQKSLVGKIIDNLYHKTHLSKEPTLFGM